MKIIDVNELTNTKYMYNKKPPRFFNYFLIVVLILACIFIAISMKIHKTEVVKLQGILEAKNQVVISSIGRGIVSDIKVQEGDFVKKGQLMVSLESNEDNIQNYQINEQIDMIQHRIIMLRQAQQNMESYKNSFNKNDPKQKEFYYKVEKYFTECSEYDLNPSTLEELGYSKKQIEEQIRIYNIRKKYFYYDNYNSIGNEINELNNQLGKLKIQKKSIHKAMDKTDIYAEQTGVVHFNTPIKKGNYVDIGTVIAKITPKKCDKDFLIIIPASQRAKIKNGDDVEIEISGLIEQEYGTIKGVISSIDIDSSMNYNNEIFYRGKVDISEDYLIDPSTSEKIYLPVGITAETRVIYNKVSYFKYFLDILGIKI